jgi:hypothetical protein
MLRGMAGGAGLGWGDVAPEKLRIIALAAAIALIGPTSQDAALVRLVPRRSFAVAAAVLLIAVLIKIGDRGGQDFIYFQF